MTIINDENKIKKILEKLKRKMNISHSSISWNIFYSKGKREINKRIYLKIKINKHVIFGKFPLNRCDKMVKKEANILEKITITQFSIPKVILKTNNGFFMSIIKGKPIEIILRKHGLSKSWEIIERAALLIAEFHQGTAINCFSLAQKSNIYSKLTGQFLRNPGENYLLKEVSVGYMHGDLDPFNMFFDEQNNKYGLIDWEDFVERGFQELDILHFLMMTSVILYPKKDFETLYQYVFLKNTFLRKAIGKLLCKYCEKRKKTPEAIINLLPTYCDYQIYRLVKSGRNSHSFLYDTFKNLFQEKGYKLYL